MFESLIYVYSIFSIIVLLSVTTVFLFAQLLDNNSIIDIFYGPIFAVSAWGTIVITNQLTYATILLASLITLWALRLCVRIGSKNWGKPEDERYATWRHEWKQRGSLYFLLRSYIQINLLQGIIITIVSLPIIILTASGVAVLSSTAYLGVGVFFFGLLYESVADWQLDQFIKRKKVGTETATIMTKGLFAYSRRPNYFGESLIWWGLALSVIMLPLGFLALLSPILITFIVTRVTGPMLEAIFLEKYPETYRQYMSRTNYFIPRFW